MAARTLSQKEKDIIHLTSDVASSDDEMDHSVFDVEAGDDSNEEEEEEGQEVEIKDKNYLAMARQEKFLRQKFPASSNIPEDEDDKSEEEGKKATWGRSKNIYYNADYIHEPGSSDDELLKDEEDEVLRIQKKKAESLTLGDYGLADDVFSDSDGPEQAFQDTFSGKRTSGKDKVDTVDADEEVKKDISNLSKEELMEVVNSSAPELVGLLADLDKAVNQLEKLKRHLSWAMKVKENATNGVTNYLEVKQTLLLSYCQAITFYLLLKSEGHSIRDHPVISRLVEIKNLLEKMEQIDTNLNLSSLVDEFMNSHAETENVTDSGVLKELETILDATPESSESMDVNDAPELDKGKSFSKDLVSKISTSNQEMRSQSIEMLKIRANPEEKLKKKGMHNDSESNTKERKSHAIKPANKGLVTVNDDVQTNGKRYQGNQIRSSKLVATKAKNSKMGSQSIEMLKIRANLEEKLKKKGMYNGSESNPKETKSHTIKPANKRLETLDDFDDDVQMNGKRDQGNHIRSSKLVATNAKKPKFVSGDDDLPKRDDIGERRRKFEMRVLTRARAGSDDEDNGVENGGEDTMLAIPTGKSEGEDSSAPEDEFYKQVKKRRAEKLKAKAQVYSRAPRAIPEAELEIEDEEKRHISYQMEKNRGLTRSRKKVLKNPRKKYKIKHRKAVIRRKGQVRDIRKPTGPYGGEATGVNIDVSRSIRFKS